MYTEEELDEYSDYMDWVREQIAEEEGRQDPRFSHKLIDIEEIQLEKSEQGIWWRHHWSITYSDGHIVVGELRTQSFDHWAYAKKAKARDEKIDILLS